MPGGHLLGFRPTPSGIDSPDPGRYSTSPLAPIQGAEFHGPHRRALGTLPQREGVGAPFLDCTLSLTVGYDRTNKQHHSLLLCLLMTSCDLSDQTKGWKTTRKIAVSAAPPWEGAGCTTLPSSVCLLHPALPLCAELSLATFWGDRNLDHLRVIDGEIQKGAWIHQVTEQVSGWQEVGENPATPPDLGHPSAKLGMVRTDPEVGLGDASVCHLGNGL